MKLTNGKIEHYTKVLNEIIHTYPNNNFSFYCGYFGEKCQIGVESKSLLNELKQSYNVEFVVDDNLNIYTVDNETEFEKELYELFNNHGVNGGLYIDPDDCAYLHKKILAIIKKLNTSKESNAMKQPEVKVNVNGLMVLKPTDVSTRRFTEEELEVCKKALKKCWDGR